MQKILTKLHTSLNGKVMYIIYNFNCCFFVFFLLSFFYFKRYFNKYKLFLETKIKYKLDWMEIEMFKHIKKLNKKKTKKQQLKL
jgi:hypothetical protein